MNHVNWQRTRDILICIICVCVLLWVAFLLLGQFAEPVVLLILSMAIAFLVAPLVDWLEQRRIQRIWGTTLVYLVVLLFLVLFGYGLVLTLVQQAVTFSKTITNIAIALPDTLHSFILFLVKQGIPYANIQAVINQVQSQAFDFAKGLTSNAFNFLLILSNFFLDFLLVAVISFYLTLDGKRLHDGLVSLMPRRSLSNVHMVEGALTRVVGNYVRGQLTLAVLVGVATTLVCFATGLGGYALFCGLLAFLFETIPMIGPFLASITPLALSLLLPEPFPRTIIVLLCFVGIQLLESNILGPRIVGHAVGLHPVAAIMTLLIGAKLFGIVGALLATPVVAVAWVIVSSIYHSARGVPLPTPGRSTRRLARDESLPVSGTSPPEQ